MDAQMVAVAPPSTALQVLVDACRAVFDGSNTLPTATSVSFVHHDWYVAVSFFVPRFSPDKVGPDDVTLLDEVRFFKEMNDADHNPPVVTCKTVYECSNFAVTVFFLPQGAAMPLHNHPGLTVFSQLLVGSAHVVAYDWVCPRVCATGSGVGPAAMHLAEKVLDREFTTASDAWVLFPDSGGNIHRFAPGEDGPCAFLDVVTPPYSPARHGPAAFYQDFPYELHPDVVSGDLTEEQRRRLAWLQEIDEPMDLTPEDLQLAVPRAADCLGLCCPG